jgi:hypothetical protein
MHGIKKSSCLLLHALMDATFVTMIQQCGLHTSPPFMPNCTWDWRRNSYRLFLPPLATAVPWLNNVVSMNEVIPLHTAHLFQMASRSSEADWFTVISTNLVYLTTLPQQHNYNFSCFVSIQNFISHSKGRAWLRVFENGVLSRIFGSKKEETRGRHRRAHNGKLIICTL